MAAERCRRIDVKGRPHLAGQPGKIDVLGEQPSVAMIEVVHQNDRPGEFWAEALGEAREKRKQEFSMEPIAGSDLLPGRRSAPRRPSGARP